MKYLRILFGIALCGCYSSFTELEEDRSCESEHLTLVSDVGSYELFAERRSPTSCTLDGAVVERCGWGHGTLHFEIPGLGSARFDRLSCTGDIQSDGETFLFLARDSNSATRVGD